MLKTIYGIMSIVANGENNMTHTRDVRNGHDGSIGLEKIPFRVLI